MLTPQEVSSTSFKKASIGGYNMSQVDNFLDVLTADYSALYSENTILKSKMKILVEKVEEYQCTEVAMRKALMTAQRMADDLVAEAEGRKATILLEAEEEAKIRMDQIGKQEEMEQLQLVEAQRVTAEFTIQVRSAFQQGLEFIDNLAELFPMPAPRRVDEVTPIEVEASVKRLLAEAKNESSYPNQEPLEIQTSTYKETKAEPYHSQFGLSFDEDDVFSTADTSENEIEDTIVRRKQTDVDTTFSRDSIGLEFGRDYQLK